MSLASIASPFDHSSGLASRLLATSFVVFRIGTAPGPCGSTLVNHRTETKVRSYGHCLSGRQSAAVVATFQVKTRSNEIGKQKDSTRRCFFSTLEASVAPNRVRHKGSISMEMSPIMKSENSRRHVCRTKIFAIGFTFLRKAMECASWLELIMISHLPFNFSHSSGHLSYHA